MFSPLRLIDSPHLPPASATIPTTDLYFLNACRKYLRTFGNLSGPIHRVGANTFTCNDTLIIIRRDTPKVIKRALGRTFTRVIYVIDDDLWAADSDPSLPQAYRDRLTKLREGLHNQILPRVDTVVVSSDAIARKYTAAEYKVQGLSPYWSDNFSDLAQFDSLKPGDPISLGYLASLSHIADRQFIFDVIGELTRHSPRFRLTITDGEDIPVSLRKGPSLIPIRPTSWPAYRKRLQSHAFHFNLYPILPGAFNSGRSTNKIAEHAISGGIGLFSDDWHYSGYIEENRLGLTAKTDPKHWAECLLSVVENNQVKNIAHSVHENIGKHNSRNRDDQVSFWAKITQ